MKGVSVFYEKVGDLLRARREDADLTQEQLGQRVGLTRTSISNFESGRQRIQIDKLYEIAEVLKLQPGELLPRQATRLSVGGLPELSGELRELWLGMQP